VNGGATSGNDGSTCLQYGLNGEATVTHPVISMVGLVFIAIVVSGTGTVMSADPQQTYRLGPSDIIRIQVFGEDDLSVERTVDGDGTITFPLLGTLPVEGHTVQEFQDELTTRLRAGYLRHPKVTVFIAKHRNFTVSGEVRKPGGFEYREGVTFREAVALAEGFTERANRNEVMVTRLTGDRAQTITVPIDTPVLPNDLIIVLQAPRLYLNGEVGRPGDYMYEQGLTIHKVITMAGGFTPKASKNRIKVLRMINGREESISVKLDDPVYANDIIVVPQRFF